MANGDVFRWFVGVLFVCGFTTAQEAEATCYGAGSIATTVILTLIVASVLAGLGYVVWSKFLKPKKDQHLILETDPERGKGEYAFDNPGFKDATCTPAEKADNAAKKWNQWSPLGVLTLKNEKRKTTLDDSAIKELEKVVSLRSHDFAGLGFTICGNMKEGIYIKDLLHRGPASESRKLSAGDRIHSVTISFEHMVYEDALAILSYASPYEVVIAAKSGKCLLTPGPIGSPRHPVYKSSSTIDLSQIDKLSKKRLFDESSDLGSNYSSLQKPRSNVTTLERTRSKSPKPQIKAKPKISSEKDEFDKPKRMELQKCDNKHTRYGVRVLPVEQVSPKSNDQNDNNANLERSIDEVDKKIVPPPVKKRVSKEEHFVREDSIKRDENNIPLEIPNSMYNAALVARKNRKLVDESPKKAKGKAPAPPMTLDNDEDKTNNSVENIDYNSDSETDNQSSVNTIELNASDITVHQSEETDDKRKTASTGDLSKIQKTRKISSSGTLERAQSLDITDSTLPALSKKRGKVDDGFDSKTSSDDSLFGKALVNKEPRLSLILDGLNTFQRNRLKKSCEWGNLEDAVLKHEGSVESFERQSSSNEEMNFNFSAKSLEFDALVNKINEIKQETIEIINEQDRKEGIAHENYSIEDTKITREGIGSTIQTLTKEIEEMPKTFAGNKIWPKQEDIRHTNKPAEMFEIDMSKPKVKARTKSYHETNQDNNMIINMKTNDVLTIKSDPRNEKEEVTTIDNSRENKIMTTTMFSSNEENPVKSKDNMLTVEHQILNLKTENKANVESLVLQVKETKQEVPETIRHIETRQSKSVPNMDLSTMLKSSTDIGSHTAFDKLYEEDDVIKSKTKFLNENKYSDIEQANNIEELSKVRPKDNAVTAVRVNVIEQREVTVPNTDETRNSRNNRENNVTFNETVKQEMKRDNEERNNILTKLNVDTDQVLRNKEVNNEKNQVIKSRIKNFEENGMNKDKDTIFKEHKTTKEAEDNNYVRNQAAEEENLWTNTRINSEEKSEVQTMRNIQEIGKVIRSVDFNYRENQTSSNEANLSEPLGDIRRDMEFRDIPSLRNLENVGKSVSRKSNEEIISEPSPAARAVRKDIHSRNGINNFSINVDNENEKQNKPNSIMINASSNVDNEMTYKPTIKHKISKAENNINAVHNFILAERAESSTNLYNKLDHTNIPDDLKVSLSSYERPNISNITINNNENYEVLNDNVKPEKSNTIISTPDLIKNITIAEAIHDVNEVTIEGPTSLTFEVSGSEPNSDDFNGLHLKTNGDIKKLEVPAEAEKNNSSLTYITEIQVVTPNLNKNISEIEIVPNTVESNKNLDKDFENYIKNFESHIKSFENNINSFEQDLEDVSETARKDLTTKTIPVNETIDAEKELQKVQGIVEEQLKKLPEMRFTTSSYESQTKPRQSQIELLRSNFEKNLPQRSTKTETSPPKSRIPVFNKTPPTSPERRDSRNLENETDKAILEIMSSQIPMASGMKYQPKATNRNVTVTSIRTNSKIPSGLPTYSSRPPVPPRRIDTNDDHLVQASTNGNSDSFKQWVFNPSNQSVTNITVTETKHEQHNK